MIVPPNVQEFNRMEDELLTDNMIVYIEHEIARNLTVKMIMNKFYSMKNRRYARFNVLFHVH